MTIRRSLILFVPLLALGGCFLPPADQPADAARFGRFVGLVARCGCTDLGVERTAQGLDRLLAGRTDAEARTARSYFRLGAEENWDNMIEICGEVCGQSCMVAAVAAPLGGHGPEIAACPVTERDLHLTEGRSVSQSQF
jgi:hypothetical protein